MSLYFFIFSAISDSLIFNIHYLKVSSLLFGNLLHFNYYYINFALSKRKQLSIAKLIIILIIKQRS